MRGTDRLQPPYPRRPIRFGIMDGDNQSPDLYRGDIHEACERSVLFFEENLKRVGTRIQMS